MSESLPNYSVSGAPNPSSDRPFECLNCDAVFEERAMKWAYNARALQVWRVIHQSSNLALERTCRHVDGGTFRALTLIHYSRSVSNRETFGV
jgi:hypothetical protein